MYRSCSVTKSTLHSKSMKLKIVIWGLRIWDKNLRGLKENLILNFRESSYLILKRHKKIMLTWRKVHFGWTQPSCIQKSRVYITNFSFLHSFCQVSFLIWSSIGIFICCPSITPFSLAVRSKMSQYFFDFVVLKCGTQLVRNQILLTL